MLAERLEKAWRTRKAATRIKPAMTFAPEGLVLGADTVLAPAETGGRGRAIRLEGREARLLAMLSAAHLRPIAPQSLNHLRKAAARWDEGDAGLAQVHLALSGVDRLSDPERAAHRLFLADGLLQAGIEPDAVLRALDPDPSILEPLDKQYDRNQPRVPAGSGRASGQWTDGSDPGAPATTQPAASGGQGDTSSTMSADRMGANLIPVKYDAKDTTGIGRPRAAPTPDFLETAPKVFTPGVARGLVLGLTAEQLTALGLFALRFGGPTAVLGVLFFPTNASLRRDGVIPGQPPIQYHWNADERILRLSYVGPDSRRVTTTAELGEDGFFRDVDRKVIGRVLPNGSIAIERAAAFPKEARNEDEPTLCPRPTLDKDHKNTNGLLFEDYMKPIVNPGNPTPNRLGVKLFNSAENKDIYFDDCQRRSGILFEYKGVTYSDLLNKPFRKNVMDGLVRQAELQLGAAQGHHIIWVFAEKDAEARVEEAFNKIGELHGRIQFVDMPWRVGKI